VAFHSNGTGIGVRLDVRQKHLRSAYYKLFTKTAQSSGPENIGPERTLLALLVPELVNSPSRITLE